MENWLIIVVGLIYAFISIKLGCRNNWPMSMVFAGYAFSNIGLYLAAR